MIDFCVFILTHGRPRKQYTYNSLKKQGYTGKIYLIIDNEDKTAEKYYELYKNEIIMFDKKKMAEKFDEADNFNDRRSIVYARNACFEIAKKLKIKYFIQLDDDYTVFNYKATGKYYYTEKPIKNLDRIFEIMLEYYKKIPALSIALAQNGDYIGGKYSEKSNSVTATRKCMNTFICTTDREYKFIGRINEDVNVYTCYGSRGEIFLTLRNIAIIQKQTQHNDGGMTEIYIDNGTYIKSFYTVMYCPSFVKINLMGTENKRLHHMVKWNNAVPKIISEKHRKAR